ncbi:4-diphosphocytidyl-2-C-methyl-D-erythritol kinase [Microbacterium terrae]|uniref:4-diphosphocytidyl-2-C-methyl-D-erythritol kinase n=1 Tax=Microbacterium terrae TaxID=69369 RepID=A0A0M2GZB7_9MICO|nr:4-(cytidine 5'-diphospho)-2-C-methyl-D-erythritol kinase [Microbacterium terrae]KJL39218.1 4-diphosphocytidyl-2-C-methyl-D-erythritol kinase [Microbacterium terrae]MBP1076848.1 4-diphosphocytidyl-2-C-methyl-D-erythritol kinase [Microbacterium terrae]GLJ99443.1 4-diphosphocytidyl-2-C-methyl-D-erythritol kinase [Microbacterium terrae]
MSEAYAAARVHVRAPGKLNVFFEVGDVQPDGYHDVASAYQAVSLYEDVWAEPSDDFTIAVSGSVDVSGVPADDRNLAVRAARLVAQRIGHTGGVHLDIVKHVPVAGGMGGGSADAAAALVACDALWGADLGSAELHRLAARLGADVPFALMGGTAIGVGRGDQLSPALAKGRVDWVLVPSGDGLSTPEVYAHLDRLRSSHDVPAGADAPEVDPRVLQALRGGDATALAEHIRNDLQAAALSLKPDLREALEVGEASGALAGIVSGSGPTLAFLAADAESALELQVTLSAAGYEALHVHGPVPGARVVG